MTQLISGARRRNLYDISRCKCTYCGRAMIPGANAKVDPEAATLDHIIPVFDGGDHTYANLAPACADCNNRKGIFPLHEFLATFPAPARAAALARLDRLLARSRRLPDRARCGFAYGRPGQRAA